MMIPTQGAHANLLETLFFLSFSLFVNSVKEEIQSFGTHKDTTKI